MVRFLGLFLLLFSLAAQAGLQTGVTIAPAIGLGAMGVTTTPSSNIPINNPTGGAGTYAIFSLYGGSSAAATGGDFYPLYKNGVQYQVASAKTAYCFDKTTNGGAAAAYQLVSSTVTFAFDAGSITSGVHQCGAAGRYCNFTGISGNVEASAAGIYTFGASTFPGFQASGANIYMLHMECYEN